MFHRAFIGLACLFLVSVVWSAAPQSHPHVSPHSKSVIGPKKPPAYDTLVEYENQFKVDLDTNSIQLYAYPDGLYIELTFRATPFEPHDLPSLPMPVTKYENTVVINCQTQNVLLTHMVAYNGQQVMKDEPVAFLYSPPHVEFTPVAEIVKFFCSEDDKTTPADKL